MLPSADAALAQRDPGLPGLAVLLDEEELVAWLRAQTGDAVRLRTRYLRYKHGTSCVLAGHLETSRGAVPCLVSAHCGDDIAKMSKTLDRAPPGSVLGSDLTTGLLATTPGADRDLPALARLDDRTRRRRLLHNVLGDRRGLRGARLQTLRHKPHRRWVGLATLGSGDPVVLRVYRPAESPRAVEAVDACGHLDVPTPRLLGADTRHGVAAVEYVPGSVLSHPAAPPRQAPARAPVQPLDGFRAAGSALGRLHASAGVVLRSFARSGEAQAVRAAATQLAVLLPDEAADIGRLASTLAGRLLELDPVQAPLHGDFSADQVVVGDDGRATLIDLDSARLGEPASDLGCVASALVRDVVLGQVAEQTRTAYLHALHEGYATVRPPPEQQRCTLFEAAHLFRRAVEPFRLRQTEHWPDASREMLARARALSDHTLAGGVR